MEPGRTATDVRGTEVTGWSRTDDLDGDGSDDAQCVSEFMAGDVGVRFEVRCTAQDAPMDQAELCNTLLVRQALCYAVDKQQIIDLAFDGYGSPIGSSMYPAFQKYFVEDLTDYYPYDPERAMELLAEAGYPDGFSMTITVPSNYQPHIDTAQVLVEQLKAVGITAEIQLVEWGTWLDETYTNRQFQSTVVGVDASNMTARALLERFVSTADDNFINYSDAQYDQLMETAQSTPDDAMQTALYKQAEERLTVTAANVYLQDLADLVALRNGLEGYRFYPIYVMDLSTVRYAQ